jgi:hypothetical protein
MCRFTTTSCDVQVQKLIVPLWRAIMFNRQVNWQNFASGARGNRRSLEHLHNRMHIIIGGGAQYVGGGPKVSGHMSLNEVR